MRVICTLPNASTDINGKTFASVEGGMVSEEMSDEEARAFLAVPGYALYDDPKREETKKGKAPAAKADGGQ